MAASAFLDPACPPDDAEVRAALGSRAPLWDALVAFIAGPCGAVPAWVHEGRASGWALRAVRAGKPFAVLYPEPGVAAIRIVIGERDLVAAFELPLGERVGATLREARRYPDGTWVYARPETAGDVADLERLLAVKLPPTIRARVAATI